MIVYTVEHLLNVDSLKSDTIEMFPGHPKLCIWRAPLSASPLSASQLGIIFSLRNYLPSRIADSVVLCVLIAIQYFSCPADGKVVYLFVCLFVGTLNFGAVAGVSSVSSSLAPWPGWSWRTHAHRTRGQRSRYRGGGQLRTFLD